MLKSFFISAAISTVLGLLTGLGIGGGSLMMLWLTIVLQMDYLSARILNLLFFLPSALISVFYHLKNRTISLKYCIPCSAAGCLGAAFFTVVSRPWDTFWLRKIFGVLLIIIAVRELRYKQMRENL